MEVNTLNANEYAFLIDDEELAQSLKMAMPMLLHSHVPMFVIWGAAQTLLHNNACQPFLHSHLSQTTGNNARDILADNWLPIEPLWQQAMQGQPVTQENMLLTIYGAENKAASLFTISCFPLYNDVGEVGGVMATATETVTLPAHNQPQLYEALLQAPIPNAVLRASDLTVEFVSEQFLQLIAGSRAAVTGKTLFEVIPEFKKQHYAHLLAVILQTGESKIETSMPLQVIRNNEPAVGWFNFLFYPLREMNGAITNIVILSREVTELEEQHALVKKSEAYFRGLADAVPVMLWMTGADGACVYVNQRWHEYTGQTAEEALNHGWMQMVHPDDIEKMQSVFIAANNSQTPFSMEYRIKNAEGKYRWILDAGSPTFNEEGVFDGFIGSVIDIDKRQNERIEELRQSEERYLRMTNEVEDYAIILLDKGGHIENWNKGAEKIKGYAADEVLGKHFSLFYTQEDQEKDIPSQLIRDANSNGKSSYEGWRVRKDGSTFWGYTVITALHNDKNEVTGFSKVTRDLTERKIAEDQLKMYAEQLEEKNRELERSNTELTSFSYVASHDLQEPLRKIQAFGNLIQARDAETMSEVSRDYFDRMVKAAVRMQNLIDSLLEFSRTATGHRNVESTDLNVLLDDVKKELAHRIDEKKATIHATHLPTIPVISFQFRQLLLNLLSNSLKYSQTNVPPVISIRSDYIKAAHMKEKNVLPGKDYYRFAVADNGIGFEQEYAEKIFDLFQRLHGRNEYSGSGIGLAICKKIVENHHGFIYAESAPDQGATFYFFIPAK